MSFELFNHLILISVIPERKNIKNRSTLWDVQVVSIRSGKCEENPSCRKRFSCLPIGMIRSLKK